MQPTAVETSLLHFTYSKSLQCGPLINMINGYKDFSMLYRLYPNQNHNICIPVSNPVIRSGHLHGKFVFDETADFIIGSGIGTGSGSGNGNR